MRMRVCSTIAMLKRHQMMSLMLLLVAMLSGCASEKAETEVPTPPVVIEESKDPESMSLLLACAPANSNSASTRLAENVVQSGNTYRPITNFRFITETKNNGSVRFSDSSVDEPTESYDYSEDSKKFRYYHSPYCDMANGVNACLVYAKADAATPPTGVPSKVYNGSLVPEFPASISSTTSTNEISFSLESILNATKAREAGGEITQGDLENWEKEVWALADALTGIANVTLWASSENAILKNLFENFTNHGFNLPGSAASVKQWIAVLGNAVDAYLAEESRPAGLAEQEINILNAIKTKITETSISGDNDYPRDVCLPDGAAALRWAEVKEQVGEEEVSVKKFVPQLETTTLDNINSVASFAYPPELYYFVDSGIKTSPSTKNYKDYDSNGVPTKTWNQFLTDFSFTEVRSNTKTVIVTDPLQYAVARLSLKVKVNDNELFYGDGTDEKIAINDGSTTNFIRLTGVIVCGQRPVNYQFVQPDNMNSDVKFIYDSQVGSDFFLTTTYDDKELHSLVLQSYDGENVNVILEFEYTGPTAFKCLNGYVYPNTRFYLVGEAKMEDVTPANPTNIQDYEKRVFTQDYTTTLEMNVTSLKKAYNVLPSILSKNLEIGVMTTTKWIAATPQEAIVLD